MLKFKHYGVIAILRNFFVARKDIIQAGETFVNHSFLSVTDKKIHHSPE